MILIQFLGEWIVRSSVLILAGALLLRLLRVHSPGLRLAAWTAMLAGSMAMPLLTQTVPKLPLTVMRPPARPSAAAVPAVAPASVLILTQPAPAALLPAAPARPAPFPWMRAAAIFYALVAAALLLRLFTGLALSLRVLRRSRPAPVAADRVEVRESDRVASPVTIGILRPAVLLPLDWRDWDPAKLHAVLAHESSHIRRRDPAVQFVSAIHRALLWASPSSWFLDRSIVRAAEQISDDDAIAATRDRVSYAEILLEFVQRAGRADLLGVPMARYDRPEKRIRRILNSTAIPRQVTRRGIAAVLLLGAPLAFLAAAARPQAAPRPALPSPVALAPAPSAEPVPAAASAPAEAAAPMSPPSPAAPSSVAQNSAPAEPPKFDVASIATADPNATGMRVMGVHVYPGGRLSVSYFDLKALIATAFGVSYGLISGGDEWTHKDLYLIEAKPPEAMRSSIKDLRYTNFTIEDPHLREMLQALLIDRFQLKFHRETKTGNVYLLQRNDKPLALRPTPIPVVDADPPADRSFGSIGYAAAKWGIFASSMPQLAKFAADFIVHAPVLDKTGLTGSFDYRQRQPDLEPTYGGDQSDSFRSFLAECGLKLDRNQGPVDYFVIDAAAKPSPN